MPFSNESQTIEDILDRLHRIKVMIWASNYHHADSELQQLYREHGLFLRDAENDEKEIMRKRDQFFKSPRDQRLMGLKGRDLKYQQDIDLFNQLFPRFKGEALHDHQPNIGFMALARSIRHYAQKIHDAMEILPKQEQALIPNFGEYYWSRRIVDIGIIHYRVYRIDNPPQINNSSQLIDTIGQTINSAPVQVDQGDTELPVQVRFFTQNALSEIALVDFERFTVTITCGEIIMDEVEQKFLSILKTINDFVNSSA